jgi:hypothetical protein
MAVFRIGKSGEWGLYALDREDYTADDWAVFDADTWKIREEA